MDVRPNCFINRLVVQVYWDSRFNLYNVKCRNPTLRECEDETHTPEMGTWESSKTPDIFEFDCRGQNTSH
jgi:hypothetical protein